MKYGTLLLPGLELLSPLYPSGNSRIGQMPPIVVIDPKEGLSYLAGKDFAIGERYGYIYPQYNDNNDFLLAFGYVPDINPFDHIPISTPNSIQTMGSEVKEISKVIKYWEKGSYDEVKKDTKLYYTLTKGALNNNLMSYNR